MGQPKCVVKSRPSEITAEVEENVMLGVDLIALRNAFAMSDRSFTIYLF